MSAAKAKSQSLSARLFDFLCSYGLATFLLAALLLVTFLGTLEQVEHGLYLSQQKYFESWIITKIDIGQWHVPFLFPGGFLLMTLLVINMLCGAIIRMRKNPRTIGVLISHVSILFLLISGAVSFFFKKDGSLALFEGQTSNEFQSFHDSVVEIEKLAPADPEGKRTALVIPGNEYQDLKRDKGRTFTSDKLPFDLVIRNYEVNAEPRKVGTEDRRLKADGYYIQPVATKPEAELNLDAAYVDIIDKKTKAKQTGIIWRAAAAPWSFQVGDEVYAINMARRTWTLPFAVRLDKFIREVHPGTDRPRLFTSEITKLSGNRSEKKIITMNAPLRDSGHILFQASFSQERSNSGGGPISRSVFAVVENPSDQWPLWSTIAVSVGLLIHMIGQLSRFLSGSKRTSKSAPTPATATAGPAATAE